MDGIIVAANRHIYTYTSANPVTLVWGSLRLTPISKRRVIRKGICNQNGVIVAYLSLSNEIAL